MNNTTSLLEKLEKWNNELARGLVLNNVILSLYITIGLLGNVTVILIYGFKMKGNNEERYFIPVLAFMDLITSLSCAVIAIAMNMTQVTFSNTDLCKFLRFFGSFSSFTSVLFLLIIAVHRYLKVCKPFRKQMTLKWKRLALCLGVLVAFILAAPMAYFHGSVPFPNKEEGIFGQQCSRLKTVNKTESLIFGSVIVLSTVSVIVALICLYSRIGYTILKHFKHKKTIRKKNRNATAENPPNIMDCNLQAGFSSGENLHSDSEIEVYSIEVGNSVTSAASSTPQSTGTLITTTGVPPQGNPALYKSSAKRRKEQANKRVVYKFTLMFMLITIIFLICYIPKVIIMMLEAMNPKFWEEFSDSTRAGILFVYRMYIINNVVNPFIYAFLDHQFIAEIKELFKNCKMAN
ncbi:succinate receptor 1-like [Saccostrea echinata]|uniref:succinate receptor 1-like n=1 Tax=Saccostrea echinata TaxID=191078 RepID=UPI002A810090|nr:succinate receptor 1-like [Saccostrea echinata]